MSTLSNQIFVVDDDLFHLEMMKQILYTYGVEEVSTFENGLECLHRIDENPKIIFLDHQMDVYSGYETLRKIKRHNPNIFVVMVSAQEEIRTAVDALKHGAFDYFQKDAQLEGNIGIVLQKIEAVRELLKTNKPSLFKSLLNFF